MASALATLDSSMATPLPWEAHSIRGKDSFASEAGPGELPIGPWHGAGPVRKSGRHCVSRAGAASCLPRPCSLQALAPEPGWQLGRWLGALLPQAWCPGSFSYSLESVPLLGPMVRPGGCEGPYEQEVSSVLVTKNSRLFLQRLSANALLSFPVK